MNQEADDVRNASPDVLVKMVIVGSPDGIGKTCLLQRFMEDTFILQEQRTIGVDFRCKNVILDGKIIKLQIWDTSGQDRFITITSSYYRGAAGILIVFDLTDMESFEMLPTKITDISRYAADDVPKMLVGNKNDLIDQRVVDYDLAKALADEHGLYYTEASALTGNGVNELFTDMARYSCVWVTEKADRDGKKRQNMSAPKRSGICVLL